MNALDDLPAWPKRQGALFQQRFANLMEIRSEKASFELTAPDSADDDRIHAEIEERLETAQQLVMTTHAPFACMVWQKMQIFEDTLHGCGDCEWTDQRQVWMFACIKANLMSLGIGG